MRLVQILQKQKCEVQRYEGHEDVGILRPLDRDGEVRDPRIEFLFALFWGYTGRTFFFFLLLALTLPVRLREAPRTTCSTGNGTGASAGQAGERLDPWTLCTPLAFKSKQSRCGRE